MSPHPKPFWLRIDQFISRAINIEAMANFFYGNRNLFIWLGLSSIIAYGYDLFGFALKIDSENHAFGYGPHTSAWIIQGRWGMALLNLLLLPDSIMPLIPTLLALTGLVFSAVFFVLILSTKRTFADSLAGMLAISCPVLYFAIYFTTLGYGVGMAFFTSCLGIYALGKQSFLSKITACACFTFAFGIYQATLPLIVSLFCLQQISAIIDARISSVKNLFRCGMVFILVLMASIALNQLIIHFSLKAMKLTFQSDYILGFINFRNDPAYWAETAKITLKKTWSYYTGAAEYYLYNILLLKLLFIIAAIVSSARIFLSPVSLSLRMLALMLLICAVFAPMMMHMLNGGYMPPRSVLGISFVLAGMVYFAASSSSFIIRAIVTCLSLACFYHFSVANNRYAFSNEMTWEADRTLSTLLLKDIQTASNDLPIKTDPWAKLPIEIVGWHEYFESPIFVHREVIGASFYTWGAGDTDRVVKVFSAMGVKDYRAATPPERLSVIESSQKMPAWPYQGSVAVINGIIVVKLREYNPNQLVNICRPPLDSDPACLKYLPH